VTVLLGFQIEEEEMIALKEEAYRRGVGHTSLAREIFLRATSGLKDFSCVPEGTRLSRPKGTVSISRLEERSVPKINVMAEMEEVPQPPTPIRAEQTQWQYITDHVPLRIPRDSYRKLLDRVDVSPREKEEIRRRLGVDEK
jgi:hypothetical protein